MNKPHQALLLCSSLALIACMLLSIVARLLD
jgi:hypothetical protein